MGEDLSWMTYGDWMWLKHETDAEALSLAIRKLELRVKRQEACIKNLRLVSIILSLSLLFLSVSVIVGKL